MKPAVCKAGRIFRLLMAVLCQVRGSEHLEGAVCWDQVLVLLQKLLCNKSAATDFAASSPLCIQAA